MKVRERLEQLSRVGILANRGGSWNLQYSQIAAFFDDGTEYILYNRRGTVGQTSDIYETMRKILEAEGVDTTDLKRIEVEKHTIRGDDAWYDFLLPRKAYIGKEKRRKRREATKPEREMQSKNRMEELRRLADVVSQYDEDQTFNFREAAESANVPVKRISYLLGRYKGLWGIGQKECGSGEWRKKPDYTEDELLDLSLYDFFVPRFDMRGFQGERPKTVRDMIEMDEQALEKCVGATAFALIKDVFEKYDIEIGSGTDS